MRICKDESVPACLLTVLTLAATGVMLWTRWTRNGIPLWLPTGVASTGFMITAVARGAGWHAAGRWVLLALAFCWAGDMAGPFHFMLGVGMFLVAHLAFMGSFVQRRLRMHLLGMAAVPVLASSGLIAHWILPHVPSGDWPPVVAYMSVITCMWLLAGGAAHDTAGRLAFIGATIFFVSDIFVARWRFVDSSGINAFICYPLYYIACLIFAWSTGLGAPTAQPDNPRA